jgi:hypothetical protein
MSRQFHFQELMKWIQLNVQLSLEDDPLSSWLFVRTIEIESK